MKKILLSLLVVVATAATASAQVEIGLKISPGVAFLRADGPSASPFKSESSKFSFNGGLVVDYFFGENYAFSTGLQLTGKGGSYSYQPSISPGVSVTVTEKLSVQYLEIPVTIKLFTNEIASDMRLYFQVGGSLATPIGASINDEKRYNDPAILGTSSGETTALSHVRFIDANAIAGLGVEYQLAKSTKAFAGFSYHRGLINLDSYFDDERDPKIKDVSLKNNIIALDLGLKF